MKNVALHPPELAFIVATRAMLAAGAALLAADLLPPPRRRQFGLALVAAGAATTIPAVWTIVRGARRGRNAQFGRGGMHQVSRFPRKGDDIDRPEPAEWLFDETY